MRYVYNSAEAELNVYWKCLLPQIDQFHSIGKPELTSLIPKMNGIHPDDAFSTIPYEKGSAFLFYLESLLGGPGKINPFN